MQSNDKRTENIPVKAEKALTSDPARSIALLWGTQTKAGRSGLTVRSIVTAAIEFADAEGLDALSMRRVADRLKVGTMSLYTHVPAKAELVDLMVDAVVGEVYDDADDLAESGSWRDAMTEVAQRNWDLYQKHPWLLHVGGSRPVLGPHTTLKYEAELRPLDGLGLTDIEMDSVLTLVLTHVEGTARAQAGFTSTEEASGETDAEWWRVAGPVLERLIDGSRFPVAGRVGQAAGASYDAASSPEHSFTFGLRTILDGVEMLIAQRS